jgi:hypothetical protein
MQKKHWIQLLKVRRMQVFEYEKFWTKADKKGKIDKVYPLGEVRMRMSKEER